MRGLPKSTATASVVNGKKSNRVKMARPTDRSPQRALGRFKKDPATRGLDCTVICISLPVGDLAEIDAACERVRMARSHFIRQAAKLFASKVSP